VKKSNVSTLCICLALLVALAGCWNREKKVSGEAATQTIEPAKPQPDLTGSDAMTQTVDVEKGRSEVEGRNANGADLGTSGTAAATSTAATSTVTTTTTQ
jgi:hypothetical protein